MDGETSGPLLSIQQWSDQLKQSHEGPANKRFACVQLVQVMPLVIDGHDEKKEVMHELTIVAWDCIEAPGERPEEHHRLLMQRRPETKMCLVFNDFLCWSVVHCHKEGHICLMLPAEVFETLLEYSAKLVEQMQEYIEQGHSVKLGRTEEEAQFSQEEFGKARSLVVRVFELADWAFANICHRAGHCCLQNISLLMTDDLGVVKPGPWTHTNRD